MAEKRRMKQPPYVYGTAVEKTSPSRQPRRDEREEREQREQMQRKRRVNRAVRRNREKALQMDVPYVLALTVAAMSALYICVSYLQVQSTITGRIHNIEKLEQEVEDLKSENDALQTRINTSVDLDHIYKVATEELGMVYANRNQVRLYDKKESEYVKQNEDIPKY
ncbi:septum formation initiator family protein [Brotaphodocola sp.]|uniref:septum formation initiator family protein n=1 Tax=Brotaphodocola sp. TaxID=3073577 RepID=UPI003D7EC53C